MSLEFDFNEALRTLDSMEKRIANKIEKTVMVKAAEVMLEGQQSTVPVGDTGKLKASLGVGKTTRRKGRMDIHIGIINAQEREVVYGYYQHYGHRRMIGSYWITRAFKDRIDDARNVIKMELVKAIKEK